MPRLFLALHGGDSVVDGVEIDGKIIEVARQYFEIVMTPPNFLTSTPTPRMGAPLSIRMNRSYDLVAIDCFRYPYIPSHMVTRECFETVRRHLNPQGALVVKCNGDMGTHITATLRSVFPQVYQLQGVSIGLNSPVGDGLANMEKNAMKVQNQTLRSILQEALATRNNTQAPLH